MENVFSVPNEYRESFLRLYPYMPAFLRTDDQAQEAIFLYLKMGGEKLARCAIDAYIQTHRLKTAENQKRLRAEALLAEQNDNAGEEDAEEDVDAEEPNGGDLPDDTDY